jgi:serine/threonine protein kinase
MGLVVEADDCRAGRLVALKLVKPDYAADEGFRARFKREAKNASAVVHPNVIPILDAGESGGIPFLVMPRLAGRTLADRLKCRPRLSPLELAGIGRQTAEGLRAAHAVGLIHRDIKPANLWLEETGNVRILDFGLAMRRSDTRLTVRGCAGSFLWMSPERLMGRKGDAKCDVYALGVTLYEALTGTPVLDQTWRELRGKVEVPDGLVALVVRLLAFRPDERPTLDEVIDELTALESKFASGFRVSARTKVCPPAPVERYEDSLSTTVFVGKA